MISERVHLATDKEVRQFCVDTRPSVPFIALKPVGPKEEIFNVGKRENKKTTAICSVSRSVILNFLETPQELTFERDFTQIWQKFYLPHVPEAYLLNPVDDVVCLSCKSNPLWMIICSVWFNMY